MTTKRCGKCCRTLPLAAFARDKSRKDGLSGKCRTCKRTLNQSNYETRKAKAMRHDDERTVLYLDATNEHRISYDRNQWMIEKKTKSSWRVLSYIGSDSVMLLKWVWRHEIDITDYARGEIQSWGRFLDWRETYSPKSRSNGLQDCLEAA